MKIVLQVVAQKFRIAKNKSGVREMVGVQTREREQRNEKTPVFATETLNCRLYRLAYHHPREQRQRNQDRRLLCQSSQRKPHCHGPSASTNVPFEGPKRESCRRQVHLRQGTLRKENRVDGC